MKNGVERSHPGTGQVIFICIDSQLILGHSSFAKESHGLSKADRKTKKLPSFLPGRIFNCFRTKLDHSIGRGLHRIQGVRETRLYGPG